MTEADISHERSLRQDLAAAYRLIAHFGWDDLIFTHLSARLPGEEPRFLINPYGMLFEEITASSLVAIDLSGRKVDHSPFEVNPAGFTIHAAVHKARDDAHCVMHLHTYAGTAVSSISEGLLPITQTAQLVVPDLAYHDYEGVAFDDAEGPRLAADLGEKNAMLLRNHGTLALGPTVAQAFTRLYFLERACAMQVATLSQGHAAYPVPGAVLDRNEAISRMAVPATADTLLWPALLRKLDRTDPSYKD